MKGADWLYHGAILTTIHAEHHLYHRQRRRYFLLQDNHYNLSVTCNIILHYFFSNNCYVEFIVIIFFLHARIEFTLSIVNRHTHIGLHETTT